MEEPAPKKHEKQVVACFVVEDKVLFSSSAGVKVAYVTGFTEKLIGVHFLNGEEDCFCSEALEAYSDEVSDLAQAKSLPPLQPRPKPGGKKRRLMN